MKKFLKAPNTIAYTIFFVVAIFFLAPAIFYGQLFYGFDILYSTAPWSELISKEIIAANRLVSDPIDGLYPGHYYLNYLYIQQQLTEYNHLPHWYDNSFGGFPFGYCYSYPLMFLLKYISITTLHTANIFTCMVICAIGMYHYVKVLKVQHHVAVFAGVAWMLSGYNLVWLEFEIVLFTAASLPLILYSYHRGKQQQKFSLSLLLLIFFAVGLSFAGSYGHLLLYQYLFIFIYILTDIIKDYKKFKDYLKSYIFTGSYFLISSISALPFIVSHLKILEYAQRQQYNFKDLFKFTGQLYPSWLISLLTPDAYGSPALGAFQIPALPTQDYNNYCELTIYGGIAVLFFAIFVILHLKKNKAIFFIVTLIATLLMAGGSGLYYPLTELISALKFSAPLRILYISSFCLTMCAVFGLDSFSRIAKIVNRNKNKYNKQYKNLMLFTLIWGGLLILTIFLIKSDYGYKFRFGDNFQQQQNFLEKHKYLIYYKSLILLVLTLILSLIIINQRRFVNTALCVIIALLGYDLYVFGRTFNPLSFKNMTYEKTPAIEFLLKQQKIDKNHNNPFRVATFTNHLPNYLAAFNIQSLTGYSSFYSRSIGDYLFLMDNNQLPFAKQNHPRWQMLNSINLKLCALANIKYVVRPKEEQKINNESLPLVFDGEVKIYQNKLSLERAFFVPNIIAAQNKTQLYNVLLNAPLEVLKQNVFGVIINRQVNSQQNIAPVEISFEQLNSDNISLELNAPCAGGVIISNTFDVNWQYKINNSQWQSVKKVNGFMQLIEVKKGKQKIYLRYFDKNLTIAMIINKIAWISFLIMLLLLTLLKVITLNKERKND
ncbi:hypothetical protein AAEX28_06230 [Lentisphaerota bacterium WC36G]|nr:hypothetical protein LJT99_09090 [Lentisphaerae bacterium WC36]